MTLPAAFLAAVAAGCSVGDGGGGTTGYVKGDLGGVAGDEPRAVLAARQMLSEGGSATDAVVTAYFTMSATLPSAASLGGGGTCLVFDRGADDKEPGKVDVLDFTHPLAGPAAGVPVPANIRGMFALHARYGRLEWSELVAPAEGVARFGAPVSRAFARDLTAAGGRIAAAPGMRRIFADENGKPLAEGTVLRQPALSAVLGRVRRDPLGFYSGPLADRVVGAYREAGISLTREMLRDYRPRWREPVTIRNGNTVADFVPNPAGLTAAQMWAALYRTDAYEDAAAEDRPHLVAEVSKRAFADAGRWFRSARGVTGSVAALVSEARIERMMAGYVRDRATAAAVPGGEPVPASRDQASVSVVAFDRFGQGVACGFTMNGQLGMVRVARGTGIVIAASPDPAGRGLPALPLMLARVESADQIKFVGAASGGLAAAPALVTTALRVLVDGDDLEGAFDAPRLYHPARPDRVMIEETRSAGGLARALRSRGHRVRSRPALGRVNALACPKGFDYEASVCDIRTDPRGFGLSRRE